MGVHVWVCIVCGCTCVGVQCVGVHVWVCIVCGCTCVGVHSVLGVHVWVCMHVPLCVYLCMYNVYLGSAE